MSRLDEIRARTEAATPGPWGLTEVEVGGEPWPVILDGEWREIGELNSWADARFVHHAREDVPWLLARLEAVRALHQDDGNGNCDQCSPLAREGIPWPCETLHILDGEAVS